MFTQDSANHERTLFADQRARLFARLGIRSEKGEVSSRDVDRLIASLRHLEEEKRREAVHALADLYEELSDGKQMYVRVHLILMMWRDASAYVRIAAIKALARAKMPDTSEALQVALRDEEPDVRAAAAEALGRVRGKTPVFALISIVLCEQEHWSVRASAIRAMGRSGERVFLNAINYALDDKDDSVRLAAIHALAQVEGIQSAPRLALIAFRDRQPYIKHAAILALENIGAENNDCL